MFNFLTQGFLGFILWLNHFFNDFGLTIIFFTLILKIVLFPIEFLSFLEEEKMKRIGPKIKEIFQKYKNDLQKQTELMSQIYKQENYNPFYAIFIQLLPLPIFLGVFFALRVLLKTPNINLLFLNNIDLASNNIFFVLAIIFFQVLTLKNIPKEQRNISLFLFVLIIFALLQFPALFSLYWLTNIILTMINRNLFHKFNKILVNKILLSNDPRQ
jgi:YidC/Oxa1 family membrane protein insertase